MLEKLNKFTSYMLNYKVRRQNFGLPLSHNLNTARLVGQYV